MTKFPVERFHDEQTPFYYYDMDLLDRTLASLKEASLYPGYCVHYAVKANANPVLLERIAASGLGADTVSIGEIKVAVAAGFPADKIVFAGVGKTDYEISEALRVGIGCFNVESEPELEAIIAIAENMGVKAPVALRVNPEIDAHTHHYITTGLSENKFGISLDMLGPVLERCVECESVEFKGFHSHIGSQVTDFTPYKILCERLMALEEKYPEVKVATINVGGGLGIDYDDPDGNTIPDFEKFFKVFKENMKLKDGQQLHFELGRAIVGQCGSLITRVVYVKDGVGKKFVITDAGMTDLIRPALYQAYHKIDNITSESEETDTYDVVGPICESSDTFDKDVTLPVTQRGDLLAIRSAGAYGEAMASGYNCRKLPGTLAI